MLQDIFMQKYLNDKFQISDKSSNSLITLGKISEQQSKLIRDFTEKMAGNQETFIRKQVSTKLMEFQVL